MNGRLVLHVALHQEARQILRAAEWRRNRPPFPEIYEGQIGGGEAVLAISGVGRGRAEGTVNEVLKKYQASAVLSLGFGGGLLPGQRLGDLVVAHTTMSMPHTPAREMSEGQRSLWNERLKSDRSLTHDALRVLEDLGLRHQSGVCITDANVVSSPDAKRHIGLATGALAVDMESFWIGLECCKRDVPFLAVRSIVDVVEHPVPQFATRFTQDTGYNFRWILPILLRPRSLPALIRLAYAASVARSSLTAFVFGFLNSLTQNGGGIRKYAGRSTV